MTCTARAVVRHNVGIDSGMAMRMSSQVIAHIVSYLRLGSRSRARRAMSCPTLPPWMTTENSTTT